MRDMEKETRLYQARNMVWAFRFTAAT
jgi:hypothetical protein